MMTGSSLSPELAICDEPKRPASNMELTTSQPIAAMKINGMQSSRAPLLKQAKSLAKNLVLSPDNPKGLMKSLSNTRTQPPTVTRSKQSVEFLTKRKMMESQPIKMNMIKKTTKTQK